MDKTFDEQPGADKQDKSQSGANIPGAIVGGLVIGIVESASGFYLPEGFKDIAPYVVVLAMLVVRPNGIFGETLRKKV